MYIKKTILIEIQNLVFQVPSSRADIFNSNDISLIDKRLLMKVIMNCSSMSIEDLKEGNFIF
jgi:RAB protein geranylgeranyltransferase component A